jgi:TonB-dependent receptor
VKLNKIISALRMQNSLNQKLYASSLAAMLLASPTYAAEADKNAADKDVEVIEVKGIRGSLASALNEKRESNNLIEVIESEDIGKLPDQNLAEVLENLTGVQITRTAGVGTGVQIRGSNSNIVQINGMQTVGTGSGRTGMKFEDLSASIIAGVEVIKSPQAKHTEGSVGGTVNLKTIRPLALGETLATIRVQGEDSSLTEDGVMPRLSGAWGDNWETSSGRFGVVASGSYSLQEATSFRPRVDRDALVENKNANVIRYNSDGVASTEDQATKRPAAQDFDYLGIQFLNQELENFEYETTNFAGTLEFAPNADMKFFIDTVLTKQEVRQESTRVQISGVSDLLNTSVPDEFETVDYGSLGGQDRGQIQAAVKGSLGINGEDPNLRFNSDNAARKTDTTLIRLGGEWQVTNDLFVSAEFSSATSKTKTPKLDSQLNFINPNANTPVTSLDADGNYTSSSKNDNAVPTLYDLTGGALTFGIDFDSMYAPTIADLQNGDNVVLDQVDYSLGNVDNSDTAFRVDANYFLDSVITSVDVGFRYNKASHESVSTSDRIGGFSSMKDSPGGDLFSELLVAGPSNFGDADGRELAIRNFVIINPDLAYNNPQAVIDTLHGAMDAHRADMEALGISFDSPVDYLQTEPSQSDAFKVEETTTALYAQANFEWEMIRGNAGVRYITSEVTSEGATELNGEFTTVKYEGDYNYVLPRVNIVADVMDDVVVRFGWGQDIKRPSFSNLNTNAKFSPTENASVTIGNPGLEPEEVTSLDLSAEWYFAEAAVVSLGYFSKDITNLHVAGLNSAAQLANNGRETDPNCPGGGVFNPIAEPNIFNAGGSVGMCVDAETSVNDTATITQSGFELAFQYDLSAFESDLGWASGFGIQANYTVQDYEGGSVENESATRGTDIFNAINGIYDSAEFVKVTAVQGLLDFSENAYNLTAYYDKHGFSARLRYTWREAFRTDDTASGASRNSTLGFPVYTHDRGQLNASVSYDVNEKLNLGIEAINLTESEITQSCVSEGAQFCFQGLADRRITFGARYKF